MKKPAPDAEDEHGEKAKFKPPNEQFMLKVLYFMKDLTQVIFQLFLNKIFMNVLNQGFESIFCSIYI